MAILTTDEVRRLVADTVDNNYLIDGEELTDPQIRLAMELTISDWNSTPPTDQISLVNFPYKHILMSGVLYRCYSGLVALFSRNTFNFSDGGIQIPLEERAQLYQSLVSMYQADYQASMTKVKISQNIDQAWDALSSDYGRFPLW